MKRESHWFDKEIREAAEDYGLNPKIVEAVVLVESSGFAHSYRFEPAFWDRYMKGKSQWNGANPRRVSASYGLCQVMYPVAMELGFTGEPEELFQPRVGLAYGCKKLKELLLWSRGNVDAALAAFNGGKVGNAEPPYRNWEYVAKVKARVAELDASHGDDETRDSDGREYVVVWSGEADRHRQCFSLVGEINQSKYAKEDRTRGATYDAVNVKARNWGPVRNGRLYE